ncbi:MAG: 23S rRNA (guanosine(2251)-2'-O)-methyltransferase RlmB [Lentisphaeraceae bacterium]|nr:23S rRNA (guanosine(2251)-2'-O)-methyltransferase RlmB [Lentisphaeraceae bacterium]
MSKKEFNKPDKQKAQIARQSKYVSTAKIEVKNEEFLMSLLDEKEDVLLLVLDCVQDPHNLGACLRSADGAGVDAVIIPKDKAVSLTPAVISVSCGGAENVPVIQVTNLARALQKLQKNDVWLVGTTDHATQSIYETDMTGNIAIVMGAEGKGMRRLTEEACDFKVFIPMAGKVDCLNVSVAAGVCMFEAVRQRSLQ